jgi:hypothetical protein
MAQFGLASADEIDTLAQRMEEEAVALHSRLLGPLQFGAWTKKIQARAQWPLNPGLV